MKRPNLLLDKFLGTVVVALETIWVQHILKLRNLSSAEDYVRLVIREYQFNIFMEMTGINKGSKILGAVRSIRKKL